MVDNCRNSNSGSWAICSYECHVTVSIEKHKQYNLGIFTGWVHKFKNQKPHNFSLPSLLNLGSFLTSLAEKVLFRCQNNNEV